ncbi:hypothetical protein HUG20_09120 [Salicibibacter cibi]|uniref:Uncharacterized protein n=1 Tax=Salicibibacter cibi TaxID=2743001 RepID=A0A7T6ZAP9_9BACI|nr:hypothetical protein [Salicibibacter cibi]QQK80033.1 hypothetical protein HUG20_09120 [Salicibibacter cibi]
MAQDGIVWKVAGSMKPLFEALRNDAGVVLYGMRTLLTRFAYRIILHQAE